MSRRTRRAAAIQRAARTSRDLLTGLTDDTADRLAELYQGALADIDADLRAQMGADPTLRTIVLERLRRQIESRLGELQADWGMALQSAIEESARIGSSLMEDELPSLSLGTVAEEAVRAVESFVGDDGLQLSERIWRVNRHTEETVRDVVEGALVRGQSAERAARDLLARGEAVPADLERQRQAATPDAIARSMRSAVLQDDGAPFRNAVRLTRTEMTRAHTNAARAAFQESPDVIGVRFKLSPRHPRRDICDMHATVNRYGLGPGVYPIGRSPFPAHPETYSYEEPVFAEEVTDEDRDGKQDRVEWLRQQPEDLQQAVLGGKRKLWAFKAGHLGERSIASPWRAVGERLRRKGIDVEDLKEQAGGG